MASIYQQLVSKYGDDALRMINKLKSGAKEVVEDVPYPKNIITQDALAEKRAFEQVGKPYSTDFSMVPEGTDLPAIIANKTPVIVPEVLSAESKVLRNIPAEDYIGKDLVSLSGDASQQASKSNLLRNTGIGAAGLGAGALMLDNGGTNQPPQIPSIKNNIIPVKEAEDNTEDDNGDLDSFQMKQKGINPSLVGKDTSSATDYLNLQKGIAPSIVPPTQEEQPSRSISSIDDQMAAAHQQDAEHQLLFGMLKAAQMGGSALAGTKADTSFADTELAKDKQFANRLKTDMDVREEAANIEEKKQKRDPKSKTSLLYQQMLNELNPDIETAGLSAEQVEKIFPQIGTIIAHRETAETNRIKNAGLIQSRKDSADKKLEDTIAKEKTELDKHLTSQTKGRSGAVQGAIAQKMRGETLNQMFENLPRKADGNINFGSAGIAHKEELIKGIDLMLSGGKSTIGGTQHLREAYATSIDKLTAIRQKLSLGKLPELGEEKIIEQMYDLMNRESDVARLQAGKGLGSSVSTGFQHTSPEDKRAAIARISDVSPAEQELMMDNGANVNQMMELKRRGISPEDALALLRTGKKLPEILKATGAKSTAVKKSTGQSIGLPSTRQPGKHLAIRGKTYIVNPDGVTATEQ